MTFLEFLTAVWGASGKGQNEYPAVGSDEYVDALMITNRKLREFARDANQNWSSLWEVRTYTLPADGIVELDEETLRLSDEVYVDNANLTRSYFSVLKLNQRRLYEPAFFASGNPLTLASNFTIQTNLIGGTLYVPSYIMRDELTSPTDEVLIDNIDWLIYAVAAELARNDPAKDDQFATLTGLANDQYENMVAANQNSSYGQPNGAEIGFNQIGDYTGGGW